VTERLDNGLSKSKAVKVYAEILKSPMDAMFGKGLLRPVKTFLNGTWLEHPLHPVLTDIPIGAWTLAIAFDLLTAVFGVPNLGVASAIAIGLGEIGALAAIVTGLMDWMDLDGADQAIGVFHGTVNIIGAVLFGASLVLRANADWQAGGWTTGLAVIGYLIVMFGGFLGGTLVFRRGVMVDRNAYQPEAEGFLDVMKADALQERKLTCVDVQGQAVLLYREGGQVKAIGAVCSHLGGPLQEGTVKGDCVECPWHYSQFSMSDGHVHSGPATAPVPAYETRVANGKLQVKRK
jgi:nitrite reductase/ring-hydroxylating ferredoxin subunit/uncharacterized membrane protein